MHRRANNFSYTIISLALALGAFPYSVYSDEAAPTATQHGCDAEAGVRCASQLYDDPASSSSETTPETLSANPIDVLTGNKYQRETDFIISDSPLQFIRHYNGLNSDRNRGLGRGWTHSYDAHLTRLQSDTSTTGYLLVQSNGKIVRFDEPSTDDQGNNVYRATAAADGFITTQFSDNPNKTSWVLPDGRRLSFVGSFLVRIEYPGHQFIKLFYVDGRLSEISDETGRLIVIDYFENESNLATYSDNTKFQHPGHIDRITLPDGRVLRYQYDANKNLTGVAQPDNTQKTYHYENTTYPSKLTGFTNRAGVRFSTWRYDEHGRASYFERANGVQAMSLAYSNADDGLSGETSITNSLGHKSTYMWHWNNQLQRRQLISSVGPGCSLCPAGDMLYQYDALGRLTTAAHVSGSEKSYIYDEHGRITEIWQTDVDTRGKPAPTYRLNRFEFNDAQSEAHLIASRSINPNGESTLAIEFNDNNQPLLITERGYSPVVSINNITTSSSDFEQIERQTSYVYQSGKLMAVDFAQAGSQDTMRFFYDELNRIERITLANGVSLHYDEFDALGRVLSMRMNETQSPIRYSYDDNNQITSVAYRGLKAHYEYDTEANLRAIVDVDGRRTELTYDAANRVVVVRDDLGRSTTYERDSENQLISHIDFSAQGNVLRSLTHLYDSYGQLTQTNETLIDPATQLVTENQTRYLHTQMGKLIRAIDLHSQGRMNYDYTAEGELASFSIGNGNQQRGVSQLFDAKGQNIGFLDERRNQTLFVKDDFGQVVAYASPDSGSMLFSYDPAGNRVAITSAENSVQRFEYDAGNRMIRKSDDHGITAFTYDETNGRLARVETGSSVESFTYNSHGDVASHLRIIDNQKFETRFEYNETGQLIEKTLPGGLVLGYVYDPVKPTELRQINRISHLGLSRTPLVSGIDSDARDGQSGHTFFNGTERVNLFHPNAQLKQYQAGNHLTAHYQYDGRGNITAIDEGDNKNYFEYLNSQLVLARHNDQVTAFEYDQAGNRTTMIGFDENNITNTARYRYGADNNQLLSATIDRDTTMFRYSDRGETLLSHGGVRFEYNWQRRPVRAFVGAELFAEYVYNSFGERIKKVRHAPNGKKVTYYFYENHQLSAELDLDTQQTSHYIYLNGQPVLLVRGKETYAIHTDHLGTPRLLEDETNDPVWQAAIGPFGKAHISRADLEFNLRLPGQYYDIETGTHYNYHRTYDPELGRYLTPDPIGLSGGNNAYLYAKANPITYFDALGLQPAQSLPIPESRLPARPRLLQPGQAPTGPAANRPNHNLNPRTASILRSMAGRGGIAGAIAVGSFGVGYGLGFLADELVLQPRDYSDTVREIQRYDPNFNPGNALINWENIAALGRYLNQLRLEYYEWHRTVCDTSFDLRLFNDTLAALGPAYQYPTFGITPYSDPYEDLFTSPEEYRRALEAYATYLANGGSLSFLDWWSQLWAYRGALGGESHTGPNDPDDGDVAPDPDIEQDPDDEFESQTPLTGHKRDAWEAYKASGGEWSYTRWSNVYNANQENANRGNAIAAAYHEQVGWGTREQTIEDIGPNNETRRLDIADVDAQRGVEVKSGYTYRSPDVISEYERDALLVEQGWDIHWHFHGAPSRPLLEELERRGITWSVRDPSQIPD